MEAKHEDVSGCLKDAYANTFRSETPYVGHLVLSNLPSHFAVIHQSTHLGGQDNFAVIMIALTSFKNDYIG